MTRDVAIAVDVRSRLMQDLVRNQSSSMESIKTFSRTVNTESRQTRDSSAGSSHSHEAHFLHKGSQITDLAQEEANKSLTSQKALIESEKIELLNSNLELKSRLQQIEQDLRTERQKVEHFQKLTTQQSSKQYKSQSAGPAITHITTSISTSTSSLNVLSSQTVNERRSSSSNGISTIEVAPIRSSSSNEINKANSIEKLNVKEIVRKTNSLTSKSEKATVTTSTTSQHIKLVPSGDTSIVYVPNGSSTIFGATKLKSPKGSSESINHQQRDAMVSSSNSGR